MGGSARIWAGRKNRRYLYRLGPSPRPKQKHPSRTPGPAQVPRSAHTKTSLACPPSTPASPHILRPPRSPAQPFAELPGVLCSHRQRTPIVPQVHTHFPRRAAGSDLSLTPQVCSLRRARIAPPDGPPQARNFRRKGSKSTPECPIHRFTSRGRNGCSLRPILEVTNQEVQHVALCRLVASGSAV